MIILYCKIFFEIHYLYKKATQLIWHDFAQNDFRVIEISLCWQINQYTLD